MKLRCHGQGAALLRPSKQASKPQDSSEASYAAGKSRGVRLMAVRARPQKCNVAAHKQRRPTFAQQHLSTGRSCVLLTGRCRFYWRNPDTKVHAVCWQLAVQSKRVATKQSTGGQRVLWRQLLWHHQCSAGGWHQQAAGQVHHNGRQTS
jgi:hypothetical protein